MSMIPNAPADDMTPWDGTPRTIVSSHLESLGESVMVARDEDGRVVLHGGDWNGGMLFLDDEARRDLVEALTAA